MKRPLLLTCDEEDIVSGARLLIVIGKHGGQGAGEAGEVRYWGGGGRARWLSPLSSSMS